MIMNSRNTETIQNLLRIEYIFLLCVVFNLSLFEVVKDILQILGRVQKYGNISFTP